MRNLSQRIRKGLASLLAAVMLLGLLPLGAFAAESSSFTDVEGHWGAASIAKAVDAGLFTGIDETTFDPDGGMTRAMFVTVLSRAAEKLGGKAVDAAGESFTDVAGDAWYAVAVAWGVKAGLVSGYGDGRFGPDDLVTREQMCTFLARFLQYMGYDLSAYTPTGTFADDASISAWAKESVYLAQALGLVQGVGDNAFDPMSTATRAAVAAIMARLLDKAAELAGPETPVPTPTPTPTPSGGSGGGGGGGSSSKTALTGVYLLRDAVDVTGLAVRSGDVLYPYASPSGAVYTIRWLVSGVEKSTEALYTVSAMDVGRAIAAEITGTGSYKGTVTSAPTGTVAAVVDPSETDPDKAPVVIAPDANYMDADGRSVTVPADASLTLSVAKSDEEAPEEETTKIEAKIQEQFADAEVDVAVVPVDVDLTLVTTVDGETTETVVHPVGKTTVTLSREALGLPADADMKLYTFLASHTNKTGEEETVTGELVTVDGVEYVRFVLNGLSRIYIGNVPPLTVTFDTDGGNEIPSQKVKLGGYAVRPEPPVKAGWLFAGWDHDLTTENIIKDIKVTATWVKGSTVGDGQFSGKWGVADADENITDVEKPEEIAEPTVSNGTVTLRLDRAVTYTANLRYVLHVEPVAGTVRAAVGPTAEAAMLSTDLKDVSDAFPGLVAEVTDAEGKVMVSSETLYIKWTDAEGKVLDLQSARLVVRDGDNVPGNYDTQTRTETKDVNRGLGQVEFYLTGGKDSTGAAIPDYVGAVNGYLNDYTSNGKKTYRLDLYSSFYESFWSADAQEEEYDENSYSGVKAVITPFEGECFSAVPTVSAWTYDSQTDEEVEYAVTAALQDGNIVLTAAKPAENISELYIDLTLDGVQQNISFDFSGVRTESTHISVETWAEAVAALNGAEYTNVTYTGAEDATLTSALTLRPEKHLSIREASLTIGSGGVLTLQGNADEAANVYLQKGNLTVADGGKLTTNSQSETQNRYYNASVSAEEGVAVADGGVIEVPEYGYLRVYGRSGGVTLAQGGAIRSQCVLYFDRDPEAAGENVFAGAVTISGQRGRVEVNDGLTIASTGSVVSSAGHRNFGFEVYGGLTVEAGGLVESSATRTVISGKSYNYGTIKVASGTLYLQNTGYSVYNMGEISVSGGAVLNAAGTVVVNTGSMTGSGTLQLGELDDITDYDNGIEYVELGLDWSDRTPASYDRYQFVRDPAATVEVVYFIGALSNQDGGACGLTVQE